MKKGLIIVLMAAMILILAGCSIYSSSYSAVGLVRSNTSHRAYLNFHTLRGRLVYNLKVKGTEDILCSGKLEEGDLTVYYDIDGSRQEMVRLSGGQSFDFTLEDLNPGKVHIIVQTDGKCRDGWLELKVK